MDSLIRLSDMRITVLLFDLHLSGSNRRFEFHKRGQLFIRMDVIQ